MAGFLIATIRFLQKDHPCQMRVSSGFLLFLCGVQSISPAAPTESGSGLLELDSVPKPPKYPQADSATRIHHLAVDK